MTPDKKEVKIRKERFIDLSGKSFGELTVLELTEKRKRRYCVWRCKCSCGREVEVASEKLLSGNTISCGCRKLKHLQESNMYCNDEGTELRKSMEEKVESCRASSGYTGVTWKRNKWMAYINYKKKRYYLGSFDCLEDAVAARAEAKAWVMEDARRLFKTYIKKYNK